MAKSKIKKCIKMMRKEKEGYEAILQVQDWIHVTEGVKAKLNEFCCKVWKNGKLLPIEEFINEEKKMSFFIKKERELLVVNETDEILGYFAKDSKVKEQVIDEIAIFISADNAEGIIYGKENENIFYLINIGEVNAHVLMRKMFDNLPNRKKTEINQSQEEEIKDKLPFQDIEGGEINDRSYQQL